MCDSEVESSNANDAARQILQIGLSGAVRVLHRYSVTHEVESSNAIDASHFSGAGGDARDDLHT